MNEITVTLPLKEYEKMKDLARKRDVNNFIEKEYQDYIRNVYTVKVNQKAVIEEFGKEITGITDNQKLRKVLKEISETPITRGISPVERQLQAVVEMAQYALKYS